MSGTSLDGIDVALLAHRWRGRGGARSRRHLSLPAGPAGPAAGRACATPRRSTTAMPRPGILAEAERALTDWHAEAVERFLDEQRPDAGSRSMSSASTARPSSTGRSAASPSSWASAARWPAAPASPSSTTCARRMWRRRAGGAAGAGLSPGPGRRAAGAAGGLRQHRRRGQHDLDRAGGGSRRLRHRPRQRASQRLVRASHGRSLSTGTVALAARGNVATRCTRAATEKQLFCNTRTQISRPQHLRCIAARWPFARRWRGNAHPLHRRKPSPAASRLVPEPPQLYIICGGGRLNPTLDAGSRGTCFKPL